MNIKNEIRDSFIDNKYLIIFACLLFFIPFTLGFTFSQYLHDYLSPVLNSFVEKVKKGIITVSFKDIILNNILVVLKSFTLSFFFGIVPAMILIFNGFFLGYFIAVSPNFWQTIFFIVPHGIFEIPALILGVVGGFLFFYFLFNLFKDIIEKRKEIKGFNLLEFSIENNFKLFKQSFIFLILSIILMIIAGIIEIYITKHIALYLISIFKI